MHRYEDNRQLDGTKSPPVKLRIMTSVQLAGGLNSFVLLKSVDIGPFCREPSPEHLKLQRATQTMAVKRITPRTEPGSALFIEGEPSPSLQNDPVWGLCGPGPVIVGTSEISQARALGLCCNTGNKVPTTRA